MRRAYFDIETTAVDNWSTLEGMDKIHCISVLSEDDNKVVSFSGDSVKTGVEFLIGHDLVVGHNIIGFDVPAIKKLYPDTKFPMLRDTLVMASAIYSDIRSTDLQKPDFPRELSGRHSLKAWGVRMGFLKGDFGESTDWSECTPEMIKYCEQDVAVTFKLYKTLLNAKPSENMLKIEHKFAELMKMQEAHGWAFDMNGCRKLTSTIMKRRADLQKQLQEAFPPKEVETKTPIWKTKSDGKFWKTKKEAVSAGYKAADVIKDGLKTKTILFNPASRDQIAARLTEKYNWKPKLFSPAGKPKIDETVLKSINKPEADLLFQYLLCIKRLGQIAEGQEAWIKLSEDGVIRGSVITNGTVSGRCSHRHPNVAQVPAVGAEYGTECRALFGTRKGYKLVGFDASGLELRCLGHYMTPYDKGLYAKEVIDGDVHTLNQKAAGLETRAEAKRFIYAYLYGCGDQLLGEMVNGGSKEGALLRKRFLSKQPALNSLIKQVKAVAEKEKYIKAIDGRRLHVRSSHSALNLLLQSCGAILMKTTSCYLYHACINKGWVHGKEFAFVGNIHDEIQSEVLDGLEDDYGKMAEQAIKDAGKYLGFRCRVDGEYKVGNNWAETH
tara:strand:- start:2884 stop:4710 length:1827 start_codon:yes stop_codon:yes gene_type:complete